MIGRLERAEATGKEAVDAINAARIEGEKTGEARGRAEERLAIALKALHAGMTIADASQLTGVAEDEIRKLAR
jgi:predicted transposase YdaD